MNMGNKAPASAAAALATLLFENRVNFLSPDRFSDGPRLRKPLVQLGPTVNASFETAAASIAFANADGYGKGHSAWQSLSTTVASAPG